MKFATQMSPCDLYLIRMHCKHYLVKVGNGARTCQHHNFSKWILKMFFFVFYWCFSVLKLVKLIASEAKSHRISVDRRNSDLSCQGHLHAANQQKKTLSCQFKSTMVLNFLKTQNCEMSVKTNQKDFSKVMQMTFICITKTLCIDALVWCFQCPLKDSMSPIHCHTNMLYCNAPVFIGPSHLQIAQYSMHNTHEKKYFRFDLWHS